MFKKSMRMAAGIVMAFAIVCTSMSVCPDVSSAAVKVKKITLEKNKITIAPFGKATIKVKSVTPGNADKAVTFKSGNKKIVSVNKKGVVTSKGVLGSTDITVTSKSNKKVKKVVKVNVKLSNSAEGKEIKKLLQGKDMKTLKKIVKEQQEQGADINTDIFLNFGSYFHTNSNFFDFTQKKFKKVKGEYIWVGEKTNESGDSYNFIVSYVFEKIKGEYRLINIMPNKSSLQGNLDLKEFTELKQLVVPNNQLTGIDVSGLTKLAY